MIYLSVPDGEARPYSAGGHLGRVFACALASAVVVLSLCAVGIWRVEGWHEALDSALVSAVFSGDSGAVKTLLTSGANALTRYRWTGGSSATDARTPEVARTPFVEHIRERLMGRSLSPARDNSLVWLALSGPERHAGHFLSKPADNVGTLKLLLDAGVSASEPDRQGYVPLFTALDADDVPAALLLLQHGANPNAARLEDGETALMMACFSGDVHAVDLLLDYGADVTRRTSSGKTAIQFAANAACAARIRLYLERGHELHVRTR